MSNLPVFSFSSHSHFLQHRGSFVMSVALSLFHWLIQTASSFSSFLADFLLPLPSSSHAFPPQLHHINLSSHPNSFNSLSYFTSLINSPSLNPSLLNTIPSIHFSTSSLLLLFTLFPFFTSYTISSLFHLVSSLILLYIFLFFLHPVIPCSFPHPFHFLPKPSVGHYHPSYYLPYSKNGDTTWMVYERRAEGTLTIIHFL